MRTTVDIEDPLLRKARKRAAERDTTLSRIVSEALRAYLQGGPAPAREPAFRLITVGTKGRPAPTPEAMRRVLDAEEAASLRIPRDEA